MSCDGLNRKMDHLTFIPSANHNLFNNSKVTNLELNGDEPLNCDELGEDD